MIRKICAAALVGVVAAMPAMAQDVRGKLAGDIVLGVGLIGVLPSNGGNTTIGGEPHVSATATPQLDLTYFMTPNFAVNVIAATSRHDVSVRGLAGGNIDLGRVWALPPTVTLQYHPLPASRFSPYLGVGLNYTVFYGEGGGRSAGITSVDVENAWGVAVNAGVDYEISPNLLANFDVKRLWLRPDVSVNQGAVRAEANLDPWIIGTSIRYRF
ncbi:OmpW family protein [Falsiroseomonas sp.]|uniref:OmpW/AlkL family protein n=1 Tax=Falsiroseomonas sp. TaxID=2870721 RepID=UPI0027199C2A|nr:OmpW family outer membrane protein [Falsiroseomonas sp.]MDO9502927.1 OmpW family outer membrane protein [Falsiroseomonas sp.]MDP3418385.1 OmpW family outer membrane protein [Falsiroseomonas sp.]